MAQVLGYVTLAERNAFEAYALDHGLDVTALANLLIVRELRTRRLAQLTLKFDRTNSLSEKVKIVAHTPTEATKLAFMARASEVGMKPTRAASILFRVELEERWLERHIMANSIDST